MHKKVQIVYDWPISSPAVELRWKKESIFKLGLFFYFVVFYEFVCSWFWPMYRLKESILMVTWGGNGARQEKYRRENTACLVSLLFFFSPWKYIGKSNFFGVFILTFLFLNDRTIRKRKRFLLFTMKSMKVPYMWIILMIAEHASGKEFNIFYQLSYIK